jgi:hypothetical protein
MNFDMSTSYFHKISFHYLMNLSWKGAFFWWSHFTTKKISDHWRMDYFFLLAWLPTPSPPPQSTNLDLILTMAKKFNVFFHGSASICTIILCSIPFLDLIMVFNELKRNQVIRDCCGTWFTSYLAQLAHLLHNFHFEEAKVPKQH